eukprot:2573197-Prymnesium_polylepis.1
MNFRAPEEDTKLSFTASARMRSKSSRPSLAPPHTPLATVTATCGLAVVAESVGSARLSVPATGVHLTRASSSSWSASLAVRSLVVALIKHTDALT